MFQSPIVIKTRSHKEYMVTFYVKSDSVISYSPQLTPTLTLPLKWGGNWLPLPARERAGVRVKRWRIFCDTN